MLEQADERLHAPIQSYRGSLVESVSRDIDAATRERADADLLVSTLAGLQIANIYIAAGRVIGETNEEVPLALLEEAVSELRRTTDVLERPLSRSLDIPLEAVGFLMAEAEVPELPTFQSPNREVAKATFWQQTQEALEQMVVAAQEALTAVVEAVQNLSEADIKRALEDLSIRLKDLPEGGGMVGRGVRAFLDVINSLNDLIGPENVAKAKERISEWLQRLREGEYLKDILRWAFDVEATLRLVEHLLAATEAAKETIDDGATKIAALRIKFRAKMKTVEKIVATIGTLLAILTTAATVPVVAPCIAAVSPYAPLVSGVAYLSIVGYVLLLGWDYAGASKLGQRVHGVGDIAQRTLGERTA